MSTPATNKPIGYQVKIVGGRRIVIWNKQEEGRERWEENKKNKGKTHF